MRDADRNGGDLVGGWFSSPILYTGEGELTLSGRNLVIRGPASVSIGRDGQTHASIVVDRVSAQADAGGIKDQAAHPATAAPLGTQALGADDSDEWSGTLTIQTADGLFATRQDCYCTGSVPQSPRLGIEYELKLLVTEFRRPGADDARFWVAPLINFASDYFDDRGRLRDHPLRLRPPKSPAPEGSPEQIFQRLFGPSSNGVILFEFGGGLSFVDWLPSPGDPERRLEPVAGSSLITALMVGEVRDNTIAESDVVPEWLPLDFADLLALATGAPVSMPWWEFRAADGQLLRRIHIHSATRPYHQSQGAIPDHFPGAGLLLTRATKSQYFRTPEMRVVIKLLLRARLNCRSIDDELQKLLIALGMLCDVLLPKHRGVCASEALPGHHLDAFLSVLEGARGELEKLQAATLADNLTNTASTYLEGVAKQLAELPNIRQRPGFAKKVELLLEELNLPDAKILDAYCAVHLEMGQSKWSQLLAEYRGRAVHKGYLGIGENGFDARRALMVSRHLQDVLLRVILKSLGYDGEYQPAVFSMSAPSQLDWVTDRTGAATLGFR